jgi:hypothetical protein
MLGGAAALGLGMQSAAHAYSATASVTFTWGGSAAGSNTEAIWTNSGSGNSLSSISNSTYFSSLSGYNAAAYYNPDFATSAYCAGLGYTNGNTTSPGPDTFTVRKYGCRFTVNGFKARAVADTGPGASASGTLIIRDTSMRGILTVSSTTDEPTGATTTFISGIRISNSAGNGTNGYNLRTADGSPFGNAWYGVTTSGVYAVSLTGTFTSSSWSITGGSADFYDAGFACQNGDSSSGSNGTLCTNYTTTGLFESDGGHLAWGMDPDGSGGSFGVGMIDVRDPTGASTISTLSGVLASLSISGGSITTNNGEIRRVQGQSSGGCTNHIRYNATTSTISCGALTTAALAVTGTVTEAVVPVPAAVWLMGSALGLLGWMRRKAIA